MGDWGVFFLRSPSFSSSVELNPGHNYDPHPHPTPHTHAHTRMREEERRVKAIPDEFSLFPPPGA